MMILSVDLSKFNTVCCLDNTQNRKYRFETIATKRSHIDHLLDTEKADLVVMELDLELSQLDDLTEKMATVEKKLEAYAKDNAQIQRVMTIPGVVRSPHVLFG